MSSPAVSSPRPSPVHMLHAIEIACIMNFLKTKELSYTERTCRAFLAAANPLDPNQSPWKGRDKEAFSHFTKQRVIRHIQHAAQRTPYNDSPRFAPFMRRLRELVRPAPLPFPTTFRGKDRFTTPPLGELGWRRLNVDPGFVPPLPAIPPEPCPFGSEHYLVFLPETINGERTCPETLRKVHTEASGTRWVLPELRIEMATLCARIGANGAFQLVDKTPLGPSSWYLATVVRKDRNMLFTDLEALIRQEGRGLWSIATAAQVTALEVLFYNITGKSFLGDLRVATPGQDSNHKHLFVGGANYIMGPRISAENSDHSLERICVLALRKLPDANPLLENIPPAAQQMSSNTVKYAALVALIASVSLIAGAILAAYAFSPVLYGSLLGVGSLAIPAALVIIHSLCKKANFSDQRAARLC